MRTFGHLEGFHLMGSLGEKSRLLRSVSFNGRDSEPAREALTKSYGSAKFSLDRSLGSEKESPERDQAALKLQKVYKSFRTRRRLADCAVMVEQRWWKLLDFAELKRSSISFFEIEKPETAVSRWSRARTRAAKVGKGISKDEKARKLALQHWLEAIDPRHRYGHNLQFYYVKWLHCESKQPFFYWLDVGEGKEVNLEICPRLKLHQQCIKYLGPTEREAYEVTISHGKFMYELSGEVVDTTRGPKDAKWIFVLSTSKTLYVGLKSKGTFQHSSFLAGGATLSAGRLEVECGILKTIWPHSGHYLPTEENFEEFITFLEEHDVDLTDVKKSSNEDENRGSKNSKLDPQKSRLQQEVMCLNLPELEIPKRNVTYDEETSLAEDFMVSKPKMFDHSDETILKENIIERIDSHNRMNPYHFGQQLTRRWSTGAGPRIGCMRDYPSDLQFQVLEEANLSPKSKATFSSPRNLSRYKQNQNSLD